MAAVQFDPDGVSLRLRKEEWWFFYSAAAYVLHGERMPDHDFRNMLMMMPDDAERLFDELRDAEVAARIAGDHWAPGPAQVPSSDGTQRPDLPRSVRATADVRMRRGRLGFMAKHDDHALTDGRFSYEAASHGSADAWEHRRTDR